MVTLDGLRGWTPDIDEDEQTSHVALLSPNPCLSAEELIDAIGTVKSFFVDEVLVEGVRAGIIISFRVLDPES